MVKITLSERIKTLEEKIGYIFVDKKKVETALTHRSFLNSPTKVKEKKHNERLEFLGDAVLELVVTEHLYESFDHDEGYLTSLRAALVNYRTMSVVGNQIGLEPLILMSRGEREDKQYGHQSIIADCVEAVIGAIYLDSGYQEAKKFIFSFVLPLLPEIIEQKSYKDAKTKLQEVIQKKHKVTPKYRVISSIGKDHQKEFTSAVLLGEKVLSKGVGRSKQDSETKAAENALEIIETER